MKKRTWKQRELTSKWSGDYVQHCDGVIEINDCADGFSVFGGMMLGERGVMKTCGAGKTIHEALEDYRYLLMLQLKDINEIIESGDLPEFKNRQQKEIENGQAPF